LSSDHLRRIRSTYDLRRTITRAFELQAAAKQIQVDTRHADL